MKPEDCPKVGEIQGGEKEGVLAPETRAKSKVQGGKVG